MPSPRSSPSRSATRSSRCRTAGLPPPVDAWAGLVYTWRNTTLRGLGIAVSTANIANGLFYIGLPVFVLSRLGGGPAEVGQLFALMGVTPRSPCSLSAALARKARATVPRRRDAADRSRLRAGALLPSLLVAALVMAVADWRPGRSTWCSSLCASDAPTRRGWGARSPSRCAQLHRLPVGSAIGGAAAPISLELTFLGALALELLAPSSHLRHPEGAHRTDRSRVPSPSR